LFAKHRKKYALPPWLGSCYIDMKFLNFTTLSKRGSSDVALVLLCASCYLPAFGQGTLVKPVAAIEGRVVVAPLLPVNANALPKAASAASIANYKIASNDLLEIEVFGVDDLKRTVRVSTAGGITIPLVGMVQVGGLTATEAETLIAARYKDNYLQNPQVSVFIKEFTTQRITIDGAVNKPGIYPLSGQITLLRALALAGGGGQLANMEDILIFRSSGAGAQDVFKYDVKKIRNGELEDPILKGDDLVVVNRSASRELLKDSVFRDVLDFFNPFTVLTK
jgi:polysaccharide biosynthesis/export protein